MTDKVSHLSLFSICFTMITATTLMLGAPTHNTSAFFAILLGGGLGALVFLIFIRLKSLHPNTNFTDIILTLFGKGLGTVILAVYGFFALVTGSMLLDYLVRFIGATGKDERIAVVFSITFMLTCYLIARVRIDTAARFVRLFMPVVAAILLLTIIFCAFQFDYHNLLPLFDVEVPEFLGTTFSYFIIPFCQVVFLCPFISRTNTKNIGKPLLWALALGTIAIALCYMLTIGILGETGVKELSYPPYMALMVLNVTSFFQRLEIILSIYFGVSILIKCAVFLIFACENLGKALKVQQPNTLAAPAGGLMFAMSQSMFSNSEQMFAFIDMYPFLVTPMLLGVPVIAWVLAEIKNRKALKPAAE